jgi:hypothetical protein
LAADNPGMFSRVGIAGCCIRSGHGKKISLEIFIF